jgi:hypothetical protein
MRSHLGIIGKSVSHVKLRAVRFLAKVNWGGIYRADNPIMLNSTCGEAVPLITHDLNEGSWKSVCGWLWMNLK